MPKYVGCFFHELWLNRVHGLEGGVFPKQYEWQVVEYMVHQQSSILPRRIRWYSDPSQQLWLKYSGRIKYITERTCKTVLYFKYLRFKISQITTKWW